jgi:hypothetical protein
MQIGLYPNMKMGWQSHKRPSGRQICVFTLTTVTCKAAMFVDSIIPGE